MKLLDALLATAGLCAVAATPAAAATMPLDTAAKLFAVRTTAFSPDLSPGGDKLLYLGSGPGSITYLHLTDLATNKDNVLLQSSGKPEQLQWCGFASETQVVCSFAGDMDDAGVVYAVTRLASVDTTTGKMTRLGVTDHSVDRGFVQFDGNIIDWMPDNPGTVLMERAYPNVGTYGETGIGVDQIQLASFQVSPVEHAAAGDIFYMTDGHGTIRLRGETRLDELGRYSGERAYSYLPAGGTQWSGLPESGKDFTPLVIDKASNSLYFLKPLNGRDALYRLKLDGSPSEQLVASNPHVDIQSVIQFAPGDPVVGYRYTDDRERSVFFDAAAKTLTDNLSKAIPDLPLISVVSRDRDGGKLLIHGSSDMDPGAYYLLDRKTQQMTPVLESNKFIDSSMLAPMKPVTIPMSDGKSIPAYVTMRTDLGAGPHPAVILPHGGPTSRDSWGYDWLVQFLAARGYVVMQPNYRGSAGYGGDFLGKNAFHEWRQVMSDIHDSADWLAKQGLADPKRMAIVGWSYGGYAALQSAAKDPRYKAVVAIAPVTDLNEARHETAGFRSELKAKEEIGNGDQLNDGSPINHAADIHAPVLLVHGTLDGNVAYAHSKRMAGALTHAGDTAELLTFAGLDHQLNDSDARTQMLARIGQLLDKTIGQ